MPEGDEPHAAYVAIFANGELHGWHRLPSSASYCKIVLRRVCYRALVLVFSGTGAHASLVAAKVPVMSETPTNDRLN